MPTLRERLSGGLVGMLVGDALGVPYEFHSASRLPCREEMDFVPPRSFSRSHSSVASGTWSDDGAQALCLLSTLLECGSLDLNVFSKKLLDWFHKGAFTPDHKIFDCGLQTRRALVELRNGVPPERSGPSEEMDNGNGSLMRVLPLALWHSGSDAELYEDARRQSLPTHGHLRSQLCCSFYVLWAREILQGSDDGWEAAAEKFLTLGQADSATRQESEFILATSHRRSASGSGYVLNTLWSTRIALEQPDYVSVVRAAIAFGDDTDTTACVAGGLAGLRHGIDAIPGRWRSALRGRDICQPLLDDLLRYRGT